MKKVSNKCVVCDTSEPAYKCVCLSRYCSVSCFKQHKEVCEGDVRLKAQEPARKVDVEGVVIDVSRKRGRQFKVEGEEIHYKVTQDMLEKLMHNEMVSSVQRELQKEELQKEELQKDELQKDELQKDAEKKTGVEIANVEEHSIVSSIVNAVRSIGLTKSLKSKRKKLMLYMENDEHFDMFCDSILREIGARDEQGRFQLSLEEEEKK